MAKKHHYSAFQRLFSLNTMCNAWHKCIPLDSHSITGNTSLFSTEIKRFLSVTKVCYTRSPFVCSIRSLVHSFNISLFVWFCSFREARPYTTNGPKRIGHKYKKAMFREFTDATFTTKKERKSEYEKHLGLMGPVIKAEVGDTVEVVFKNMASREYSVHSDGLFYK